MTEEGGGAGGAAPAGPVLPFCLAGLFCPVLVAAGTDLAADDGYHISLMMDLIRHPATARLRRE